MTNTTPYILLLLGFLCLPTSLWAFPTNGVLDTFTGTDNTSPPTSNFTNAPIEQTTNFNMDLEDNAATNASTGAIGSAYYNLITTGEACEAYLTIVNTANTTSHIVYCRLVNIGASTTDGYAISTDPVNSLLYIYRLDNGVNVQLTPSVAQAITTTDKLGIKTVGNQICAWYNDSGAGWTQLACRTDGTYSAGGRIGMGVYNGNVAIGAVDDFGGGTVGSTRHHVAPIFLE